jgi:hypothetical protein
MVSALFRHHEKDSGDRVFKYLPNDVRGPIIAAWGIRGAKTALRDDDEKVRSVVADALAAGDIDADSFEDGLTAEILVTWLPLTDLWSFWRGGKLTKAAILKALETAFDLALFDARWFLETLKAKNGTRRGTDVVADGLSKEELALWIRRIHESGDGSPRGIVAAIGWDRIVTKSSNEALFLALDALAAQVGLVGASARDANLLGKLELVPPGPDSGHAEVGSDDERSNDKPSADENAWSFTTSASAKIPPPPATEDAIAVVVDDDLIVGDASDQEDDDDTPSERTGEPPGSEGPGALPRFDSEEGK